MASETIGFMDSRTAFVLASLSRLRAGHRNILDAGFLGDDGAASLHYSVRDSLQNGDSLAGIDVNAEEMERFLADPRTGNTPQGIRTQYRTQSLYDCDFAPNSFDAILLCEVLEHLDEPYGALRRLAALLKPGGLLILTYPNPLSLPLFARYLIQRDIFSDRFIARFRGSPDHLVFPHPASLAVALRGMGFSNGSVTFIKIYGGRAVRFIARLIPWFRKFGSYAGICAQKGDA